MFGPFSRHLALGVLTLTGQVSPTIAPAPGCRPGTAREIAIVATTDVHGRVRAWDYYAGHSEASRGLTRAATIVDSIRHARPDGVVTVDAGDLLQGNPFSYVAARRSDGGRNPIIAAMNAVGYDAAAIGNHEFNYGVPYLDSAIHQATFPFLGANAYRADGKHAYRSSTLVERGGVRIAIIGATTPGSNLWDAANLKAAQLRIGDVVPAVASEAASLRARADVIVVLLHSGLDEPSSYDTLAMHEPSENVALRVAREVPGIDVVVYGHSHKENGGTVAGRTLLIQPKNWATSVAVATVPLVCSSARAWETSEARGTLVQAAGHAESAAVLAATESAHRATVEYVTSAVGSTPDTWSADSARVTDTPLMDFILDVERRAASADIAVTAAFDTHARLGPGAITVAQLAQLYPYENTLRAVRMSGAQLRAFLEQSNRYYKISATRTLIPDTTIAGYNFDVVSGVEYTVDVARPIGYRVVTLTYRGKPVASGDSFTVALNNYRQAGGGGYAMLAGAPVVYDRQQDIRQLLIDEVRRRGTIRESDYFVRNWSFVKE